MNGWWSSNTDRRERTELFVWCLAVITIVVAALWWAMNWGWWE